jgi:hypothetical protein
MYYINNGLLLHRFLLVDVLISLCSHNSGYDSFYSLGRDAVRSGINLPAFLRNVSKFLPDHTVSQNIVFFKFVSLLTSNNLQELTYAFFSQSVCNNVIMGNSCMPDLRFSQR